MKREVVRSGLPALSWVVTYRLGAAVFFGGHERAYCSWKALADSKAMSLRTYSFIIVMLKITLAKCC